MKPWYSNGSFIETTASWVWNTPKAAIGAPVTSATFIVYYFNPTNTTLNATLHIMADNSATVSCNGARVGSVADNTWLKFGAYPKLPIKMVPGQNSCVFIVTNVINPQSPKTPNPAGVIYAVLLDVWDSDEDCNCLPRRPLYVAPASMSAPAAAAATAAAVALLAADEATCVAASSAAAAVDTVSQAAAFTVIMTEVTDPTQPLSTRSLIAAQFAASAKVSAAGSAAAAAQSALLAATADAQALGDSSFSAQAVPLGITAALDRIQWRTANITAAAAAAISQIVDLNQDATDIMTAQLMYLARHSAAASAKTARHAAACAIHKAGAAAALSSALASAPAVAVSVMAAAAAAAAGARTALDAADRTALDALNAADALAQQAGWPSWVVAASFF
ncbi:MAG: hypothetical protein WDW38_008344 [Sanguina aurantia]